MIKKSGQSFEKIFIYRANCKTPSNFIATYLAYHFSPGILRKL